MGDFRGESVAATQTEIPRKEWETFLDGFSRRHADSIISIETATRVGRVFDVEQLHLKGISLDCADGNERVYVQMGERSLEHVTHTVKRPRRILLKTGAQEELDIMSADGTTTVVRIRLAAQGEGAREMSA